ALTSGRQSLVDDVYDGLHDRARTVRSRHSMRGSDLLVLDGIMTGSLLLLLALLVTLVGEISRLLVSLVVNTKHLSLHRISQLLLHLLVLPNLLHVPVGGRIFGHDSH
ncbi:hypothetical protein PFISCL1PPCAC_8313, partial [Pristionchus fissidentatus]